MKKDSELILKSFYLITLIILYYITSNADMYLYVLSLCLYNIFYLCISNTKIDDHFTKLASNKTKTKLFKIMALSLVTITGLFTLLSIGISDIINLLLHISDSLPIFIMAGISVLTKPLLKLYIAYLENTTNKRLHDKTIFIHSFTDNILLIIIALLVFRVFKINNNIAIALLYLSKIISTLGVITILYLIGKASFKKDNLKEEKLNYKKIIKNTYLDSFTSNLPAIIKNIIYYISIVVVYYVLNSRYAFQKGLVDESITFIYLYAITIADYLIYVVKMINRELPDKLSIPMRIYQNIKLILPVSIILAIISPLTCHVIFNNSDLSIYFVMVNFLTIFMLLYDITYNYVKSKKIILVSLICGLTAKVVLIIPLINSFYRMGYNLLYGDILSTIIAMFLAYIINYIYIRNKTKTKEKYFERILDILYSNIILTIILVLLEFIIPIKTNNYFKSLGLIVIYLFIGIGVITIKNRLDKKE